MDKVEERRKILTRRTKIEMEKSPLINLNVVYLCFVVFFFCFMKNISVEGKLNCQEPEL